VRGDNSISTLSGTGDDGLSLVWTGSTYFIAWKGNNDTRIFASSIGDTLFEGITPDRSRAGIPVLASDPRNGNVLMLYQASNGDARSALFNPGDILFAFTNSAQLGYLADGATPIPAGGGKLSFDPRTNEWLVAANGRLMLFGEYMDQRLPIKDVAVGSNICVACATPVSVPAADLRFEQFPGATSFDGATCAAQPEYLARQ
jgi:hypothetical protein